MDPIDQVDILRSLKQHAGWSLLEQYIQDRMADHHNRLLSCDPEEITKHRERHAAYKSVLNFVEKGIQDGLLALEEDLTT